MRATGNKCSHGCAALRDYLDETGMEQKDFAEASGISPTFLNHCLYGRKRPSGEYAFKIEAASKGKIPASSWFKDADKLTELDGVGATLEQKLYGACHTTYARLARMNPVVLADQIDGLGINLAKSIVEQSQAKLQ